MQRPDSVDFEAIKRDIRISQVLASYTRVPQRDKYRIPCVLHGGEDRNFVVDEDRGLFHCFVCGAAGDVVVLLAKLEGISNVAAGRLLASEYGIRGAERTSFNSVWNETRKWERKQVMQTIELPPSQPLNEYRQLSKTAIDHFGLRQVSTGVLIPFREVDGRVVGYAIRQTDRQPKYLNSEGFRKADFLYGLFENQQYIAATKAVILCEGQFSVIRVWSFGYKNVVATLGASLAPSQAQILGHWVNKITVLYDGDGAGRAGAAKAREMYSSIFNINIVNLPEGEDPDGTDLGILNNGE